MATADERRAALEALARARGIESPVDPRTGLRRVWHRAGVQAELICDLGRDGSVARHELTLLGDVVGWQRGRGFFTGGRTDGTLAPDEAPDAGRLERASRAMSGYTGPDRLFVHLQQLLERNARGEPAPDGAERPAAAMPATRRRRLLELAPPAVELWAVLAVGLLGGLFLALAQLWRK